MKLVVLSGAGMSAESGIPTFRGAGGLWEGYRVEEVASPEAWVQDPNKVLRFYNERRKGILAAVPNRGHYSLAEMEKDIEVSIITQNIDDLHERAGSSSVLHLHGEILKSRSTVDNNLLYPCTSDIKLGDTCEKGSQLRPHIVWFGEMVPMIEPAINIVQTADAIAVIGTSMLVYPAAALVQYAPPEIPVFIIDPNPPANQAAWIIIQQPSSIGVDQMHRQLLDYLHT